MATDRDKQHSEQSSGDDEGNREQCANCGIEHRRDEMIPDLNETDS